MKAWVKVLKRALYLSKGLIFTFPYSSSKSIFSISFVLKLCYKISSYYSHKFKSKEYLKLDPKSYRTRLEPQLHNDSPIRRSQTRQFLWHSSFFLRFYLFISRERGREGEKYQCMVTSGVVPTGDVAHNPGMCPDWESNQRPFGLQPTLNPLSYTSQGLTFIFMMCEIVSHSPQRWRD